MFDLRIHAYLRALAGARSHRIGPFLASIDAHDPGLFRNYAIPDDGIDPEPEQIEELARLFTGLLRTPRLEYLPDACPRLEQALLAAAFIPERRLPVMSCRPADARTRPLDAGIALILATDDEQLRQVAEAQGDAYGGPETTDDDVARLRRTVAGGGLVALALDRATGLGVGGGLCTPPHDGVSELAAVGVRTSHRRRGIAAALVAHLTWECPAAGITLPFLTPAGDAQERIYRSVGYRPVTEMLHISRPAVIAQGLAPPP